MESYQSEAAKMIQDKLRILFVSSGKNKIVYFVIFINIVIIGVYLLPTGSISAYYVISSRDNGGHGYSDNVNGANDDNVAATHAQRNTKFDLTLPFNSTGQGRKTFGKVSRDNAVDNDGGEEEDDIENGLGFLLLARARSVEKGMEYLDNAHEKSQLSSSSFFDNDYIDEVEVEDEGEVDEVDEESFVYSPAFPKQQKPIALSNWIKSPDSPKHFQPIDQSRGWVFSAFFVSAGGESVDVGKSRSSTVRGFVMLQRHGRIPIYCHFYGMDKTFIGVSRGKRRSMKDGHGTKFAPCFIECKISKSITESPSFVSMTFDRNNANPSNQVKINYPGSLVHNFTVCFSPLHSNYNFTSQLVEAFEFNRLLGAGHFVVYNFSISPQTDAILRGYQSQGLVTIIQWPLPNLELWYYGQVLAVNDCIYKNRGTSKYVVVTDTDELILPHKHSRWIDLIQDVVQIPSMREQGLTVPWTSGPNPDADTKGEIVAWSFRCSFYAEKRLEMNELEEFKNKYTFTLEQKKFLVRFPSSRMLALKRLNRVFPHAKRSKTIVRPECVDIGGVHIVSRLKKGYKTAYVTSDTAMLHHYRMFKDSQYNTLDLSALKFKDGYLERVGKALMKFPKIFPDVVAMS